MHESFAGRSHPERVRTIFRRISNSAEGTGASRRPRARRRRQKAVPAGRLPQSAQDRSRARASPTGCGSTHRDAQLADTRACKDLHRFLRSAAWGHDVTQLLGALPAPHQAPPDLLERGKALDKHYLPARYPNGFAAGTPRQHYTRRDAERAVEDAEAIIAFCERSLS